MSRDWYRNDRWKMLAIKRFKQLEKTRLKLQQAKSQIAVLKEQKNRLQIELAKCKGCDCG